MVYGLPTTGEADWGTKVNASIEAVKTTADAAETEIAGRLSEDGLTASYGRKVRPQQFGAIGDGTTDDTAAVQAAAAAVEVGGTLDLGDYVYAMTAPLVVDKRMSVLGDRATLINHSLGFSGSALISVSPTAKTSRIRVSGVRLTLPENHGSDLLEASNVGGGEFSLLSLSGGRRGISIGANTSNTFFRDISVASTIDGVWIEGDTGTAELFFVNLDISAGIATTPANSGVTIHRDVAGDVGGYHFVNTLVAMGSRACTYGFHFDGSSIASGYAGSPVYLTGSAADGMLKPIQATNWGSLFVENGWLFSDDPTGDVVTLSRCTDVAIINNRIKGGANAIAFRGGASAKVQVGWNRMPDATYAYYFDADTPAVVGLRVDGDSIFSGDPTSRVTNSQTKFRDSMSDPTFTNPRRYAVKSSGAINSVAYVNELGHTKWIKVGAANSFQIADSAFSNIIFEAFDTGDVRANRALKTQAAATGSRPSASSVGAGGMWYDTTLAKPIWSDGTAWRDAAGVAV